MTFPPRRRRATTTIAAVASTTLIAGLTMGSPAAATTPQPGRHADMAAVDRQVTEDLTAQDTTTFWVYLEDTADMSAASTSTDRAEQGRHVYTELTSTAEASQADLVELLDRAGVDYESFWIANTVKVTGDADLVDRIAALSEVDQITADHVYAVVEPEPATEQDQVDAVEWNIDRINAPQVWSEYGVTGEDIVIGSIDTGVDHDHPALVDSYRGNNGDGTFTHDYNWWDPTRFCGNPSVTPCDNNNHGTHTMGTMVGNDSGGSAIGVAPGARWIAAKGCEVNNCSQAALLSAGQFMLAPTDLAGNNPNPDLRPHIINNSWGGGATADPWYQATVQAWVAAGIFPQFASGNPGPACGAASNPGNMPEAYSAGAFDINGAVYVNSGRGPSAWGSDQIKPNIAAPGVAIRSAVSGGSYGAATGTSMASPHVAGTVALMWSAAPSLVRDIDATREILDGSAVDTEDLSCGGTAENNNVFGQGRLDAFEAVSRSPIVDTGTVVGSVTSSAEGSPVSGATVTITGGDVDRNRVTGTDGSYQALVPVGEYTISATAYGFEPGSATATVTADGTTTVDLALVPLDSVTVSGMITDGSGHGWPLYARIAVKDTPVVTYTDPTTGTFSLAVPDGDSYDLTITSEYPGYTAHHETITAAQDDVVVDAALTVDQARCRTAAGYEFQQPRIAVITSMHPQMQEYFDSLGVAADYIRPRQMDTITGYDLVLFGHNGDYVDDAMFLDFLDRMDAEGTGVIFLDHVYAFFNGLTTLSRIVGNPASTDTTVLGGTNNETYYEVTQTHPILDGFDVGDQITLEPGLTGSAAWFDGYEGEGRQVIAEVGRPDDGTLGSGIGVQQRPNNRHVLLSMHGHTASRGPSTWSADAEQIFWNAVAWATRGDATIGCAPVDGELLLGHVTDANTAEGIVGARITSDSDPDLTTTSRTAGHDPALGDGFYWMFVPATGSGDFTASRDRYTADTRAVDLTDGITEVSFAVTAGQLSIDQATADTEVRLGDAGRDTITVTNTGTAPATLDVHERHGTFRIRGIDGVSTPGAAAHDDPGTVRRIPAPVSYTAPAEAATHADDTGTSVDDADTPATIADRWTPRADLPTAIMDNAVVDIDDQTFSFGGSDGDVSLSDVYVHDGAADEWTRLDDAPMPLVQSAHGVIDGTVYLAGSFEGMAAQTWSFDPDSGEWAALADMPDGRAASGSAVLDGDLYVVGGCTTAGCFPFAGEVYRYDPDTDTWDTLARYPERAAFLSCGAASGLLACSGGVGADGSVATTHVYDPDTDRWTRGADMPVDLWGSRSAGANGLLIVSGGAALNGSMVTNEGYAYDPIADIWSSLPAAPHAVYRGAGTCGLTVAGGSAGGFNATPVAATLPGYDDCAAVTDVSWLAPDVRTATLDPGDSVTITTTTDSGAAAEQQPGSYTSALAVGHDTPYRVDAIDVSMTVTPPPNWGMVTGLITGNTCNGDPEPLPGAGVTLAGSFDEVSLTTDSDGRFGHWLAAGNNRLRLEASAAGHDPQSRTSIVRPRRATEENFTLVPDTCR